MTKQKRARRTQSNMHVCMYSTLYTLYTTLHVITDLVTLYYIFIPINIYKRKPALYTPLPLLIRSPRL